MIKTGMLQENTYVISKGNLCLVVDPGSELNKINEYLNSKNLKTKAIFLTHGHYDHIGAAKELALLENCKIYASIYDKELYEDASKNGSLKYGKKEIVVDNITYFEEEIILDLDDFVIEVIFSPGHTPGGVSYIIGDAVFTGDTLFNLCIGGLFEGTIAEMFNTLQKIKNLPDDTLFYPGHEYTLHCLNDALYYNQHKPEMQEYLQIIQQRLSNGQSVAPISLKLEKACNPYLCANNLEEFSQLMGK